MTKAKAKRRAPKRKHVVVPVEELNVVEKGIVEAKVHIDTIYERFKKWMNK